MRFLADECCDFAAVRSLRADGHDVLAVSEFQHRSVDKELMELALTDDRILLTEDKDFGDRVFRRERAIPGVVLTGIGPDHPALKAMRLAAAIERYGEGLFGRYTVIEEGRFRSRRLWSTT